MSQKDYGCFFCEGKTINSTGSCEKCGHPINVSSPLLLTSFGDYKPVSVLGRGFNGWTLKVEDEFQSFAMKVIPLRRTKKDVIPDKEARALAACSTHRNIAKFLRQFQTKIKILETDVEVLCLVFEFIDQARTLGSLVADDSVHLTKTDVVHILIGISSGLARMHSHGLWHADLHDDNLLVRTIGRDENLPEKYEVKLIDFGSTKEILADEPEKSDYAYLSKHIFNVVHRFEYGNQSVLTPSDRIFSSRLRRLAHRLADQNVSRRNLAPAEIIDEIRLTLDECATGSNFPSFKEMKDQSGVSLAEPLANTNALSLAPQDIALLFRDSLGWQGRLEKSEAVLVVGPRGCGKTMLLRYMSIASSARPRRNEQTQEAVSKRLSESPQVGFLVNVGHLRTPFLRSAFKALAADNVALAEDFCREFFNLQFVFEVARTAIWLRDEKLIELTNDDTQLLISVAAELIGKSSLNLEQLTEIIDRRVMELSNLCDPQSYIPTNACRDDVLHRLAQGLRRTSLAKNKEVWFLLDDYSATVLPTLAQLAYNPVLFRLSSEVRIKASSEGDGPVLTDTLGRKYREGRELTKVNLGAVYFQANEADGREFFEKILEARFHETGKGSLEELRNLLGEHKNEENFGQYIRDQARPGNTRFYGFGLLCRLCSGDVSFIIELLHTLTQGMWGSDHKPISPVEQDRMIKRFAQRQLADLHATSEHGKRLHDIALAIGNLIKSFLLKSKNEPDERLRIEIEGTGELSAEAQLVHDALLRHSVLICGGSGKSQEGLPALKFYFRRLFAPCFPFSPTRKGCIALTLQTYEKWLLDPDSIPSSAKLETIRDGDELPLR